MSITDAERKKAWDKIKPKRTLTFREYLGALFWPSLKRRRKALAGLPPDQEDVRDYVEKFNLRKIKDRDKQREELDD